MTPAIATTRNRLLARPRHRFQAIFALALFALVPERSIQAEAAPQGDSVPNIVLILADDKQNEARHEGPKCGYEVAKTVFLGHLRNRGEFRQIQFHSGRLTTLCYIRPWLSG